MGFKKQIIFHVLALVCLIPVGIMWGFLSWSLGDIDDTKILFLLSYAGIPVVYLFLWVLFGYLMYKDNLKTSDNLITTTEEVG